MVIWFYTRNLLLPYYIYVIFIQDVEEFTKNSPFVQPFFCYLLGCMFMLHCYWFAMFVMMLLKFARTNQTEDEQSKIEDTPDDKKE